MAVPEVFGKLGGKLFYCFNQPADYFLRLESNQDYTVNSEYSRLALSKVGNPNVLINLISRRVRQLNSGGGAMSRPLILDTAGLGAADIALREIIDEKMGWETPEELRAMGAVATGKKRSRR